MDFAVNAAKFSYCKRKQVGAVLVKDDIIVIGYNGSIPGFPNECEDEDGETMWHIQHAEANALGKIMNSTLVSTGATMYCTLSPCVHCAGEMVRAKIKRFVYVKDHSDQRGLDLMRKVGIEVEKLEYKTD